MKLLLPVLIIILGIALFFGLTQPLLSSGSTADPGIAELKQEKEVLESALNTARLAAEKLTVLETQYNAITPEQKAALQNVLPNTIDEVRLIIYVQNIGMQNKTLLKGVAVARLRARLYLVYRQSNLQPVSLSGGKDGEELKDF
ncbi:MAG: hypothetical protein UY88_C0010G0006 [Parcubacteria group bacterium GW2011_GWA1_54_88]|nr:MAG: hypothetical protein UY88_C0010G0006 [Parcubacteria group bacterium GW2011_GWA1_54_88]